MIKSKKLILCVCILTVLLSGCTAKAPKDIDKDGVPEVYMWIWHSGQYGYA